MKHIILAIVTLLTLSAISKEMNENRTKGQVIELNCSNHSIFCK